MGQDMNLIQDYGLDSGVINAVRMEMERDVSGITDILKIIGEPIRLHILNALAIDELCVCVLTHTTKYQHSALSYHLKLLKNAGYIDSRKEGNFQMYSLTVKGKKILKIMHEVESLVEQP